MIWRARPDDVEDDIILRCIELGLRAPSGSNGQNWEFVVIRDPAVKHRLGAQYRRVWPLYRRLGHRLAGVAEDDSLRRAQRAVQWQIDRFEEPPVLVACCLRGGRADELAQELRKLLRDLAGVRTPWATRWAAIGTALGVSRAAAHERFSDGHARASGRRRRSR